VKTIPVIEMKVYALPQEKREALMKGLVDAASKVLPEVPRTAFYVYIRDYPPESIGIGGVVLPKYMESLEES
jgi:phenylpyruvate tautomerase PptA (4-oxalocrotonate tautomerase family)